MKLNLGSGTLVMKGWLNVDHRKDSRADVIDDAFALHTLAAGTVDEIAASHILEHACYDRAEKILQRWHQVLKPDGILWIAVPNFKRAMQTHFDAFQRGQITWEYFNSRIFGNAKTARGMYGKGEVENAPGIYKYELAFHRAVFTPGALLALLQRVGFTATVIPKLPFKFKHPDEFCVKGVKQC